MVCLDVGQFLKLIFINLLGVLGASWTHGLVSNIDLVWDLTSQTHLAAEGPDRQPGNGRKSTPYGLRFDQWKTGDRRVNVLSGPPSTEPSKAQSCLVSGDTRCDWASASNKRPAVPPYGSCQRITQYINPSQGIVSLLTSLSLTLTAVGSHLSRRVLAPYPYLRFSVPQKTWPKTGPIEKIPTLHTHSGPLRICLCISTPKVEFFFLVPSLSKCQSVCALDPSPLNWL